MIILLYLHEMVYIYLDFSRVFSIGCTLTRCYKMHEVRSVNCEVLLRVGCDNINMKFNRDFTSFAYCSMNCLIAGNNHLDC